MKKSDAPKERTRARLGFLSNIGTFFANLWRSLVKTAKEDLDNPDVFRRMGAAAIWMFLFFALSWVVSFFLFKMGLMEKTWLVDKFFGIKALKSLLAPETGKDVHYWPRVLFVAGKILLHYLVVVTVFIFLLNHFRVGRINLGYVFLFAYALLIGVVVGTKSFPYFSSTRLGALITFIRFSLWQLLSFMLATVATTGLAAFATPGWLQGNWARIRPLGKPDIDGEDLEVLLYAVLILIASSIAEARLIDFYKMYL
ncbi:MAG: hypothetical protein ACM3ZC_07685 [Bacteroidota bacterium]